MFFSPIRPLATAVKLALPLTLIALSGCASLTTSSAPTEVIPPPVSKVSRSPQVQWLQPERSPVQREGRYTLASTLPRTEQLDLLSQVIDIRVPDTANPTVQEAMRYVLRHSGYRLCPATGTGNGGVQVLYAHPLPAAHYRLGPITVRNALLTLAGPAWHVKVDEKARSICFVARDGVTDQLPTTVVVDAVTGTTGAVSSPAALPLGGGR
ncbi:PilL N-terminal domain-containing protein [Pseudomonas sp. MWU13-2105]|uniref:PFGI-1 class ICE element type IV pilus protein PilL2 n=1 Tax=Pseudomonas sp. MWU13-2105 TaxID=2935074 RepID=UPI00200C0EA4|nr:PilL N-terminal domain-containing protein [Pseudomonas sp. MWU13-2105]